MQVQGAFTTICPADLHIKRRGNPACNNPLTTGDALIDRFLETLNARGLEPLTEDEVPDALRSGPPDQLGWCDWKIRPAESNPWVAGLEKSVMPHHSPKLFLSLISPYRFAEFEVGPILFSANTGQAVSHWGKAPAN